MHLDLSAEFLLTLLVTAVLATGSAAGLFACEYLRNRRIAQLAPAVFAGMLVAVATLAFALQQPVWLTRGCLVMAAALGAVWTLKLEQARSFGHSLMRPKAVWAALLCASAVLARLLAVSVLNAVQSESIAAVVDLSDVPVTATEAMTDKGRGISLFHFKMNSAADEIQRFIQHNEKDHAQLIRLIEPNPASNCHGWVFTDGKYGVRDPEVSKILSDNDYAEVAQPETGDLAIYRRGEEICHSGLVKIAEKHAPVLIESKWGPLGVYLHATSAQPFGGECRFYRSSRTSHTLALRPSTEPRATAAVQNANRGRLMQ